MKILYDHTIFSLQDFGGISRYFAMLMSQSNSAYDWHLPAILSHNHYLHDNPRCVRDFPEQITQSQHTPFWVNVFNKILKKSQSIPYQLINQQSTLSALQDEEFDIFHPTYYEDYFWKDLGDRAIVLTVHDMIHELYPEFFPLQDSVRRLKFNLIHRADHIIAISQTTKQDIVRMTGIEGERVSVVHHGCRYVKLPEGLKVMDDLPEKYILFIGSRDGYKNFYFFVSVLAKVMEQDRSLHLVCTGRAFSSSERVFLASLEIENRVHHYSVISDEVLAWLYSKAICFVFPSLYEGFGLPILEAFAYECPAVLSATPAMVEVGKDAALYFEPKDSIALCDRIKKVCESKTLREDLCAKGRQRLEFFSCEKMITQTAEVYASVIKKKGKKTSSKMNKSPVLFLIFNRPDTTQKVFEAIRTYQPEELFIAADGPRSEVEKEACTETRKIVETIDWPCQVSRLYRSENLGCRKAVSQAIDWFFEQKEEGIILEDDCLPDATFFSFCQAMLERYRHDTRVGHISGSNCLSHPSYTDGSYRFSFLAHVWGWASWRRAWRYYDVGMAGFETFSDSYLKSVVGERSENVAYWKKLLKETQVGLINTWDYQWNFALWSQGLLSISPEKNLIRNIGFDERATHTKDADSPDAKRKLETMKDIVHPRFVQRDWAADSSEMRIHYGIQPLGYYLERRQIKRSFRAILRKGLKKLALCLRLWRR